MDAWYEEPSARKRRKQDLNAEQLKVLEEFQLIGNAANVCEKPGNRHTFTGRTKAALSRARKKCDEVLTRWKEHRVPHKCWEYLNQHDPQQIIISRFGLTKEGHQPVDEDEDMHDRFQAQFASEGQSLQDTENDPFDFQEENTLAYGLELADDVNANEEEADDNDDDTDDDDDDESNYVWYDCITPHEDAEDEDPSTNAPLAQKNISVDIVAILRDWCANTNPPLSCVDALLDRLRNNVVDINLSTLPKNARALLKVSTCTRILYV